MAGFANPLTPQEIENLSEYFASQRGLQQKY